MRLQHRPVGGQPGAPRRLQVGSQGRPGTSLQTQRVWGEHWSRQQSSVLSSGLPQAPAEPQGGRRPRWKPCLRSAGHPAAAQAHSGGAPGPKAPQTRTSVQRPWEARPSCAGWRRFGGLEVLLGQKGGHEYAPPTPACWGPFLLSPKTRVCLTELGRRLCLAGCSDAVAIRFPHTPAPFSSSGLPMTSPQGNALCTTRPAIVHPRPRSAERLRGPMSLTHRPRRACSTGKPPPTG